VVNPTKVGIATEVMVDAYPSLITTKLQKLAQTTRLDGYFVVLVSINKFIPGVWLLAMGVSGPTPVLGAITNRIVLAQYVDDLLDLHVHLHVFSIFDMNV